MSWNRVGLRARGPEFESSAGPENFTGKQMCKQCNMTLVNNLVVQTEHTKQT